MCCDNNLWARTAMLAGEILLISGAEIFRIEDTIRYILNRTDYEVEAMVFSTGIFINIKQEGSESITLVKRIGERSSNLHRIYLVNQVSRSICSEQISVEEAYNELKVIKGLNQYSTLFISISYVLVAFFFGIVYNGSFWDCCGAAVVGLLLGFTMWISSRLHLSSFCSTALGGLSAGFFSLFIKLFLFTEVDSAIVIISAIMPLVPGGAFTTAVRDILNGDHSSGVARMVEATVNALAVASGVGAGMSIYNCFLGGFLWK
ncbi:threonine/serine ThrE exporter family protein [Lacrimispora sp.]|uniref:threonine/serine ThrE exporter family protein n=1 Tax=Lacrimispora sp. TaxID=2719234 RepID=UPI00289F9BC2|nr:threonine/serine exporter family protein [Lacrimispora sp.]